eukprot:gb/GECH01011943.1/.p1 GENE.gb/GECH01011943.1/~~gb/GECH01011943.1/.p1  ORF type:complete len:175 (+),score=40.48 gb/GECH01011943.1/:1-525(+)
MLRPSTVSARRPTGSRNTRISSVSRFNMNRQQFLQPKINSAREFRTTSLRFNENENKNEVDQSLDSEGVQDPSLFADPFTEQGLEEHEVWGRLVLPEPPKSKESKLYKRYMGLASAVLAPADKHVKFVIETDPNIIAGWQAFVSGSTLDFSEKHFYAKALENSDELFQETLNEL